MGKSSSSKRKRRSKASSSSGKSRKSQRIKSRGAGSKKSSRLRRRLRHDSDSSPSGSDYDSSLSDSYSSSEDDSRRRNDGRKRRKRVRGNFVSSSSDDGSPPSKRRKGAGRKGEGSRSARKSGKGGRYRRGARDGYSSCSTCADSSVSEGEGESLRGRYERRESRVNSRDMRSRDRSGSRSSYGRDSMFSGDSRNEERAVDENNSKRLRSIIVVVNAKDREGEENKEEMFYDKNDYPSSRSNDSNDDEIKKEPGHNLCDVLDTKGMFENRNEVVVSDLPGEPSDAGGNTQDGYQGNCAEPAGANHEDLESALRQRALLNLQKLQGVKKSETSHACQKSADSAAEEPGLPREDQVNATGVLYGDSSVNVAQKSRIIKEKAVFARLGTAPAGKQCGPSSVGLVKRTVAIVPRQVVPSAVAPALSNPWRTAYTWRRESAVSQPPAKQLISHQKPKPLQEKLLRTETSVVESPRKGSALNQLPTNKLSSLQKLKPLPSTPMATETINSASLAESSQKGSALGVTPKPSQAKPIIIQTDTTASAVGNDDNGSAADQTSLNKSQQQSSPAANQLTEAKAEPGKAVSSEKVAYDPAKECPRYEQKTMSVTRGGETIQVNYEVYIPKRASALARRQLKRDS